jgi:hypothetical protein
MFEHCCDGKSRLAHARGEARKCEWWGEDVRKRRNACPHATTTGRTLSVAGIKNEPAHKWWWGCAVDFGYGGEARCASFAVFIRKVICGEGRGASLNMRRRQRTWFLAPEDEEYRLRWRLFFVDVFGLRARLVFKNPGRSGVGGRWEGER